MADRWLILEKMVTELGDLYALEVEAAGFPEISDEPAVRDIHRAVLRAADAMSRINAAATEPTLQTAREALDGAVTSAAAARRLLAEARAARNLHA